MSGIEASGETFKKEVINCQQLSRQIYIQSRMTACVSSSNVLCHPENVRHVAAAVLRRSGTDFTSFSLNATIPYIFFIDSCVIQYVSTRCCCYVGLFIYFSMVRLVLFFAALKQDIDLSRLSCCLFFFSHFFFCILPSPSIMRLSLAHLCRCTACVY